MNHWVIGSKFLNGGVQLGTIPCELTTIAIHRLKFLNGSDPKSKLPKHLC